MDLSVIMYRKRLIQTSSLVCISKYIYATTNDMILNTKNESDLTLQTRITANISRSLMTNECNSECQLSHSSSHVLCHGLTHSTVY